MSRFGMAAALAATALAVATAPAAAQVSTGRYAPEGGERPSRFLLTVGAGALSSGDLFAVPDGALRNFVSPSGTDFGARRFTVTLDENVEATLGLAYLLGTGWRLRLDLTYGKLDLTALARTSEVVDLVPYDQFSVVMGAVALERALSTGRSYPYLLAGGAMTHVSADFAADLNQTVFGPRVGIGFHWTLDPSWALRLEIRDTIHQLETSDHKVPMLVPTEESPRVEQLGPQHFFEIGGALAVAF